MKKINHYTVEGVDINIPAYYDERLGIYIEDYPDFDQNPIYTSQGYRFILSVEDACKYALPIENDNCIACSDCRFYRKAAPKTLFGVCMNENNRKSK